jgi:hypothetical protein
MRILTLGLVALAACKTQPPIPPPRFLAPPLVAWSEDHQGDEQGSGHYSTEVEVFREAGRGEVRVRTAVKWSGEDEAAHVWMVALDADELGLIESSVSTVKLLAGAHPPSKEAQKMGPVSWTLCVRGGDVLTCETRHAIDWKADPSATALFDLLTELQRRARESGQHFEEH